MRTRSPILRELLRRAAAIALLALLAAPWLLAVTVSPDDALPICCRAHGMHHCFMMRMAEPGSDAAAPHFAQLTGRCPYDNAAPAPVPSHSVTPPRRQPGSFHLEAAAAHCLPTPAPRATLRSPAHGKRGPPVL